MMDRLEEIKFVFSNHTHDVGPQDVKWLISEVERLQGDKVEMSKHMATLAQSIATLREALEEIVGMCSYTKYFDGSDWRDLVDDIKKKALATAKEE